MRSEEVGGAGDKNMGDFEMLGFGGGGAEFFFFCVFFLSLPPHGGEYICVCPDKLDNNKKCFVTGLGGIGIFFFL